jgi:glycosyltransferase involved in cell wall biosynthesis
MMSLMNFGKRPTDGLVSIVIPTFNKDRFIGDTLESISQQAYTNWELLVVEDSSRGETEEIVKRFARRHRRHRVEYSRNERNCGAAHSRNVGFAKARGEFVALIDADDRWLPDHLAVSVDALRASGKDIVYSSVLMVEDQTELLLGVWGPDHNDLKDFPHGMFRRNFVTPSATVMRREVLADVGPWGLGFRYCEDADYWFRCLAAGKTFHYIGGVHCLYRKNHDGATTQRVCGTLEEFAQISERFVAMEGLRGRFCRKNAAQAYINAAKYHANTSPSRDPSADASRSAGLMMKAWRLRRQHVDYLWDAARMAVKSMFSRPSAPLVATPAVAPVVQATTTLEKAA